MAIETPLPGVGQKTPTKNNLTASTTGINILDIRHTPSKFDTLAVIREGLRPEHGGEKTLPTLLLYDQIGLKLFEKITFLEEYYLTNAEIEVLGTYAGRVAQRIQPGSIIIELGSG